MILTNLHMVDIPYARKVSCARESKVIEVTHTLLHLSLAHMDELDSRACICASFCKVLCSPHNCLPAHHSGHHSSLRSPPDAIYCPFAMGGCKLVVGDVDVLLAEGKRQHGDAIEEESLLEMLCSTVREEMKVVQCWILDHQQLQYLDDGCGSYSFVEHFSLMSVTDASVTEEICHLILLLTIFHKHS